MKNNLPKLPVRMLCLIFLLSAISSYGQYCPASGPLCNTLASSHINTVNVTGGFNNPSGCGDGTPTSPGYSDFTVSVLPIDMAIGSSYTITVFEGLAQTSDVCQAWIDFNGNGLFTDVGDTITMTGTGATSFTGTVNVPAGTPIGITRMRIRVFDIVKNPGFNSPCANTLTGEVEDYAVNITASAGPYCAASGPTCDASGQVYISNVTVAPGGYSNNSGCASGGSSVAYSDFSGWYVITMVKGTQYTINVKSAPTGAVGGLCLAWIDLNDNKDFTDPGESITMTGTDPTFTGTITIPGTLSNRSVRLRIRYYDAQNPGFTDPCGATIVGEVEDYTVDITDGPQPPPPPPTYCPADGTLCDNAITNVTVAGDNGGINNSTGCETNNYGDYTSLSSTMSINSTYQASTTSNEAGYFAGQVSVWIDWNNNGDFSDAGENVFYRIYWCRCGTNSF